MVRLAVKRGHGVMDLPSGCFISCSDSGKIVHTYA